MDIREQFLLNPEVTSAIAEELGIRHPRYSVARGMTTDLYITYRRGNQVWYEAYAIKPSSELDKPRVREKLAIEREYWRRAGIPWRVLTEQEIPEILVANMQLVHARRSPRGLGLPAQTVRAAKKLLEDSIQQPHTTLDEVNSRCDSALNLPRGTCMKLIYYFIASGQWKVDLMKPLSPFEPLEILAIDREQASLE